MGKKWRGSSCKAVKVGTGWMRRGKIDRRLERKRYGLTLKAPGYFIGRGRWFLELGIVEKIDWGRDRF